MRKALKAVTLMGLAAALIAPAATVKAADMDMGSTKVTIGGQLRERLEWDASEPGSGVGKEAQVLYRARLKVKAELSDGVTAVFVPQAYGNWGENGQGLGVGEKDNVGMHEAYMLLANPFGINNVIVKIGRQEVNLGNQRLVGAVDWTMAGRSLDGALVGYVAGDYGLAGFFYGKLDDGSLDVRNVNDLDGDGKKETVDLNNIELFVATWQGKFKPFGIGGTYEITDIYVNPQTANVVLSHHGNAAAAIDINVNTLYGRVTPTFDTDFAKIKLNLEGAIQSGNADVTGAVNKDLDFNGYFYSIGVGATFTNVAWTPSVSINYDFYSGDEDTTDGDIDAFWAVLPTAHKWTGHYDIADGFLAFNGTGLVNLVANQAGVGGKAYPGVQDIYAVVTLKPTDRLGIYFAPHYFKTDEDVTTTLKNGKKVSDDTLGWETDLEAKYKYSKNLCLKAGWYHFDPDDAYKYAVGNDDSGDHIYVQADLKF